MDNGGACVAMPAGALSRCKTEPREGPSHLTEPGLVTFYGGLCGVLCTDDSHGLYAARRGFCPGDGVAVQINNVEPVACAS